MDESWGAFQLDSFRIPSGKQKQVEKRWIFEVLLVAETGNFATLLPQNQLDFFPLTPCDNARIYPSA